MKKNDAFRRAAALMAALSITVSLAAPAFAGTYYIDDGDITITKDTDGKQTVQQNGTTKDDSGEIIITTRDQTPATRESDLEGPAAEDSGFSPVVEDNYQPAPPAQPVDDEELEDDEQLEDAEQLEDTEEPEDDDQLEDAEQLEDDEEPEDDEQQAQPQQAAPTSVNEKFWKNTITVINNFANTALKLTLKDVKIDVSDTGNWSGETGKAALSVQGTGDVEIELDGKNELKSGQYKAGLEKNTSEGTLTLKDDNKKAGSLTATGGLYAAGIGGSYNGYHGRAKAITINGGTVTAIGGDGGAGIGGGVFGSAEAITINGGRVTATGGDKGAGIGGGGDGSVAEAITINGGRVTATGGDGSAGIGGGYHGRGKKITINGGTVNAAGGDYAAGIGGGGVSYSGGGSVGITNGENITINGGTVTATGGFQGAGIGGGQNGNGQNITINDGRVTAHGGENGAGIGGGIKGKGEAITINGGTVNAAGGAYGAGIGGGYYGSGSNVTVSGAAQVTAKAGKRNGSYGGGATIGNGGNKTPDGGPVDAEEIKADISGLMTTGYIHHIIYNEDGSVKQEWREFGHLQPAPDTPNAPAEESNEVDLGTPGLHVETLEGDPLPFNARRQGSTLRVTSNTLAARLHGTRQALEALREQGVEQIEFVTTLKTTTLSVEDLLAEGGSWFALEHDGLVSRQLSAAQAESLK